ncbi:ABC transporter permease [Xanthomonas sacchari]|uniref:ABC transporter permease n=1 Tax=Xanthomonas sacchari TaxID=56458 RepID=UPI002252D542|nr:ABC transporter permease [Xanthomonas sacchari]MCW0375718.1 hypothetical protein [Xanthomonas sacchari]MCW0386593.1 hypothetical protein [Xanthomonas sacchari]UYK80198.1 ABC transporter permease [Xanthomonas sacchari]
MSSKINPHQPKPTSLASMFGAALQHRQLLMQMIKREVVGRYRGSILGMAWSFFNPLLMLSVYTFVFTTVFKARWAGPTPVGKADFALLVFVGLVVHGLLAECINKAPSLITSNVNYVKKVVFPLDLLAWVLVGSALFHAGISLAVLLCAELLLMGTIPWTVVLFPMVVLPIVLGVMGVSWFLAASGVYLRDIAQVTGIVSSVLLFISPVFYPAASLPEWVRPWLNLNPLTYIIEEGRNTLIFGVVPSWGAWLVAMSIGLLVAWLGYIWFQKTRKGFADVL